MYSIATSHFVLFLQFDVLFLRFIASLYKIVILFLFLFFSQYLNSLLCAIKTLASLPFSLSVLHLMFSDCYRGLCLRFVPVALQNCCIAVYLGLSFCDLQSWKLYHGFQVFLVLYWLVLLNCHGNFLLFKSLHIMKYLLCPCV